MKPGAMALMCLMLAAVWLQDVDSKSLHGVSSSCCLETLKKQLPLKTIMCYKEMSPTCSYSAVIFRLKKGRETCALTNVMWVQDYLKKVNPCLTEVKRSYLSTPVPETPASLSP
ncbi:C-C motif chemokine 1 [Arvicanthis niloticus]|uniref:C-C motif chemokine 1 n=1 Tax=Arvicanthis niloticus TaxID=61156 RepID=UPI001485D2BA|nr:C-C motif chemokine 1 [Arvicanthis niloticus]